MLQSSPSVDIMLLSLFLNMQVKVQMYACVAALRNCGPQAVKKYTA